MNIDITSKSIDGITDLVVWAPLKDGFIDAFENITYETRLKLVAEALNKVRVSSREHETISPFADTAERILSLLDFRIGISDKNLFEVLPKDCVEPTIKKRRFMYLVATFDGPWEPYMRLIWKPLGPFLDLLLCNCEGYVTAQDNSFTDYIKWVREHQLDSAIFYSTTGLTVRDHFYLSKLEKIQRENEACVSDAKIARMTHDDPEVLARAVLSGPYRAEAYRLALEALTVLYRLAEYYPPDHLIPDAKGKGGDGRFLLRAADDLLLGWKAIIPRLPPTIREIYKEPLDWFMTPLPPALMPMPADPNATDSEVQKGILSTYDTAEAPITHGALLLMKISDPALARNFIRKIKTDFETDTVGGGHIFRNVAFTFGGLERMGLSSHDLSDFPKEFRDGSVDRAPQIGDVRENHPRRWKLPERNWPEGASPDDPLNPPVDISEIDFVIQLRTSKKNEDRSISFIDFREAAHKIYLQQKNNSLASASEAGKFESAIQPHPLVIEIGKLAYYASENGASLLGIESMVRHADTELEPQTEAVDHFGFVDGISQPSVTAGSGIADRDIVPRGDLLCGYRNSLGDFAKATTEQAVQDLKFNGSYLVVRKMSQDRAALDAFVTAAKSKYWDLTEDEIVASLVGRRRDGTPLITATDNNFDFENDVQGEQCPFASHIRRTNPRDSFHGRPAPRIMRRGMSYGDRYDVNLDSPRGSVFMAYCASIAEQFEVIQRWINTGNSTKISSSQNDPLVGIGQEAGPRIFRFIAKGEVRRLDIPKPFVVLEWSVYLFVPSRTALEKICAEPTMHPTQVDTSSDAGREIIAQIDALHPLEQPREWKRLLEDFRSKDPSELGESPGVWAAIRDRKINPGVLRLDLGVAIMPAAITESNRCPVTNDDDARSNTPVVLVATQCLILDVLSNYHIYSMVEQQNRVAQSFGDIFVAMDPGGQYYRESKETNDIIWQYSEDKEEDAFNDAYKSAEDRLVVLKSTARPSDGSKGKSFKIELRRDFLMPTLGALCSKWFDIPDVEASFAKGEFIERGGWGWTPVDQRKPRCPGDFMAPSRYSFYPRPTNTIQDYGKTHGAALKAAAPKIVAKKRADGNVSGKISKPMFAQIKDDDVLARNLIGIMEGMLPPTDGILRGILYEWLDQKTLWRHQAELRRKSSGKKATFSTAKAALESPIKEAMCKRPAPDLIYRTATQETSLGGEEVKAGDTIILGLVSAMQQSVLKGSPDVTAVFGGNRMGARQAAGEPAHACPAQKMVMASVLGILSALFDSGRIEAQPSSLIIKISEFETSPRS